LGGGVAAAVGGRRGREKFGGAPGDIWNAAGNAASVVPWNFPVYQTTARATLVPEWDTLRAEYATLDARLLAAYNADPAFALMKGGAPIPGGGRTPGTWRNSYLALDGIRNGLENLVDYYRVDPPTLIAMNGAAAANNVLTVGGGPLALLEADMIGAMGVPPPGGNQQDAVIAQVGTVRALVLGQVPPELLPQPPGLPPAIVGLAPRAVTAAGHAAPVKNALIVLRDAYTGLRTASLNNLNALAPGTNPAGAIARTINIHAFEAPLLAAIATYTSPITAAVADQAARNKAALTTARVVIKDPAPGWLQPLQAAIDGLLPIVPPPLAAVNAAIAGFNPGNANLVYGHPPLTVAAVRDTVAATAALAAAWRGGNNRQNKGARGNLVATDAGILALENAVAVVIADYTAPLAAALPAQSVVDLAQLQLAYNAVAARFPTIPIIQNIEVAFRRIAPIPVAAIPADPNAYPVAAPLTAIQKLIHLDKPPVNEVSFVENAPATIHGVAVIEASSEAALDAKLARGSTTGTGSLYGLVFDKPGDRTALLKAVAINLGLKPPAAIQGKPADRLKGATGWLYSIVRLEGGGYFKQFRDYIKPELYAVV
jgi:hypothetical protein